ncbi:MAG: helix-turn-helix domain-containing protein [Halieaceae bacterium]|jgi:AraC-like DNA-binding protein|nr:helix-turn-helix domain-containing protein [Halieaceae bacterium]MBT5005956.1 helix-turn-helix domain-containing protein [Halieaceae bacterium]
MKVNQVQREFLRQLISQLEEAGVSREQLFCELRARGVATSGAPQAAFAGSEAIILVETAVDISRDHCLMLGLGQELGVASYGSFGFALMSCASLRESVQLLLRYGQVLFQPSWTAYEHEGGLFLRANVTLGTAAQQQLVTELIFSNLSAVGRSLYGNQVESVEGVEIQLSYSKPSHSACYNSAFRAPVTYDCEHSQLFLPPQVLDTPVKTANRSEHVVFQQQCEEILRGLNSVEKTTAAVRQLLIQSAGDFLDIAQVAESLHVSERTLRRRLDAESTNFRATFEEIKDLLAREYLVKTELTVAEIAHLLDYAETVNFRRAFVRWNGVTPSQYRLQQF